MDKSIPQSHHSSSYLCVVYLILSSTLQSGGRASTSRMLRVVASRAARPAAGMVRAPLVRAMHDDFKPKTKSYADDADDIHAQARTGLQATLGGATDRWLIRDAWPCVARRSKRISTRTPWSSS